MDPGSRCIIAISEDVLVLCAHFGCTQATRAVAAVQAAERIGFPEARIPLAVAIVELALSPKSNSAYQALDSALADIRSGKTGDIPRHLRDAHYQGAKDLGHGVDYKYPHSYEGGWVEQQYLPNEIKNKRYYNPKTTGKFEQALKQVHQKIKKG